MTSPFPGMNPYLEDKRIWPGFHQRLTNELADSLNSQIGPKYYADVEVHTALKDINIATKQSIYPDVGIFEPKPEVPMPSLAVAEMTFTPAPIQRLTVEGRTKTRTVKVYVTETDELVTAIEILSPANKRGDSLLDYRRKRKQLLNTSVHLVELDLLRVGQRPGPEVDDPPIEKADYVLLINRHRDIRPRISEIWPVSLNEALPILGIPLLPPDPVVPLDLNAAIQAVYQRAGYSWRIDYGQAVPPPKVRQEMKSWLEAWSRKLNNRE